MRDLLSVVLASASPRRLELLASLGLEVYVVPSGVDEGERPGYEPRDLAALHCSAKAEAVARTSRGVVIAADTVVDCDGIAFGKPAGDDDAARMLRALSGRDHLVHTAYVAVDTVSRARIACTVSTRVHFAALDDAAIAAYVATGEPHDKAGAYGVQGRGAALVERIDGDFYTVMGFPVGDFIRRLPDLGYRLARAGPLAGAAR